MMRLVRALIGRTPQSWVTLIFVAAALALVFFMVAPTPVLLLAVVVVLIISWLKRR